MSKAVKKVGVSFDKATPALVKQVEVVIADAKRHTFSVSKVYAAHNAVFELKETPQTCASCLQNRADKLATWYGKREVKVVDLKPVQAKSGPATEDEVKGEGVTLETYIVIDGEEFIAVEDDDVTPAVVVFTPAEEGAQYGIATDKDGKPATAYVYNQSGVSYMVSGEEGRYTVVTGEPIAEVKPINDVPAEDTIALPVEETTAPPANDVADLGKLNVDVLQSIEGVTVLEMKDPAAQKIMFVTADKTAAVIGSKGTVKHLDGSNVKTGTHELADGTKLAVAVAGKAAIKA